MALYLRGQGPLLAHHRPHARGDGAGRRDCGRVSEVAVLEPTGFELLVELARNGAISSTRLHLADPSLPRERAEAIGVLLGRMHEAVRFAIGDWLLLVEALFPVEFSQMSEVLGLSEEGRRGFMRVSERVPRSPRRASLSWSHHRAGAALPPAEQKAWLKRAAAEDLSHAALRDALREGEPAAAPGICRGCKQALPVPD